MPAKSKIISQATLIINDIPVTVRSKRIKNLYLKVRGPSGNVEVSAPDGYSLYEIEDWLFKRHDWLVKQRQKFALQPVQQEHQLVSGEQHRFWGENITLKVVLKKRGTSAKLSGDQLQLTCLPHYNAAQREQVLNRWYRGQMSSEIDALLALWQPIMGVYSSSFGIKIMKTRWGTCNIRSKKIWLNLELVKKPVECLEYVVVHELVHLFERYHNARFYALMDNFLPDWRERKKLMNELI